VPVLRAGLRNMLWRIPLGAANASQQILSFALAGVYSGMWWLRWARHGASAKMWPLLGWFSGLMCVGSVAGCVAWGAASQANAWYFEAFQNGTRAHFYNAATMRNRWQAVFFVPNGIEFLCLIIPKLLLMGRLASNATRSLRDEVPEMSVVRSSWRGRRILPMVNKVVAAAVVLCGVVGMSAYTAGAAYASEGSRLNSEALAACDPLGNDTNSSLRVVSVMDVVLASKLYCLSVQSGSEAVALIIVTCAYLLLVTLSVAIFRQAEKVAAHALTSLPISAGRHNQTAMAMAIVDDTMHAAAEQRRRLTLACVIVLICFLFRAAFNLLDLYSTFDVTFNSLCPGACDECQPLRYVVKAWLTYTPEFQPLVVALSSPLPLTLSLWLITAAHTRALALQASVRLAMTGA